MDALFNTMLNAAGLVTINGLAVISGSTIKFAELVTVLHGPLTSTEYIPELLVFKLCKYKMFDVAFGMISPALFQTNENGPAPLGVVANVADWHEHTV